MSEFRPHDGLPPVEWLWSHTSCRPNRNYYTIDALNMVTIAHMMKWTLALMQMTWFEPVAWGRAVRRFFKLPEWHPSQRRMG